MKIKKDWKYWLGIVFLIYSFLPYLLGGVLLFFHIPLGKLFASLGIFILSAELSFLVGVALLGKPVIQAIKEKLFVLFKQPVLKAASIRKAQHCMGIVLLILSFLPYFVVQK